MDAYIQDALSKRIDHVLWWKTWGICLWVAVVSVPALLLAAFASPTSTSTFIGVTSITPSYVVLFIGLLSIRAYLCSRAVQRSLLLDRVTSIIIWGLDSIIFLSAFVPLTSLWGEFHKGVSNGLVTPIVWALVWSFAWTYSRTSRGKVRVYPTSKTTEFLPIVPNNYAEGSTDNGWAGLWSRTIPLTRAESASSKNSALALDLFRFPELHTRKIFRIRYDVVPKMIATVVNYVGPFVWLMIAFSIVLLSISRGIMCSPAALLSTDTNTPDVNGSTSRTGASLLNQHSGESPEYSFVDLLVGGGHAVVCGALTPSSSSSIGWLSYVLFPWVPLYATSGELIPTIIMFLRYTVLGGAICAAISATWFIQAVYNSEHIPLSASTDFTYRRGKGRQSAHPYDVHDSFFIAHRPSFGSGSSSSSAASSASSPPSNASGAAMTSGSSSSNNGAVGGGSGSSAGSNAGGGSGTGNGGNTIDNNGRGVSMGSSGLANAIRLSPTSSPARIALAPMIAALRHSNPFVSLHAHFDLYMLATSSAQGRALIYNEEKGENWHLIFETLIGAIDSASVQIHTRCMLGDENATYVSGSPLYRLQRSTVDLFKVLLGRHSDKKKTTASAVRDIRGNAKQTAQAIASLLMIGSSTAEQQVLGARVLFAHGVPGLSPVPIGCYLTQLTWGIRALARLVASSRTQDRLGIVTGPDSLSIPVALESLLSLFAMLDLALSGDLSSVAGVATGRVGVTTTGLPSASQDWLASRGLNRQQLVVQTNAATPLRPGSVSRMAATTMTGASSVQPQTPARSTHASFSDATLSTPLFSRPTIMTSATPIPLSAQKTTRSASGSSMSPATTSNMMVGGGHLTSSALSTPLGVAAAPLFDKSVYGHHIAEPHIMHLAQCVSESIYLIVTTYYQELPRFQFSPAHAALLRRFTSFSG